MKTLPAHLRDRPVVHGLPVPHVAAWSSEVWDGFVIDPVWRMAALSTAGAAGRGQPVWGVINEPRQRRSVGERRCQVCDRPGGATELQVLYSGGLATMASGPRLFEVTAEPPVCPDCAAWSRTHCPGLLGEDVTAVPLEATRPIASMIDPTAAPMGRAERFEPVPRPARKRLSRAMEGHPEGLLGVVKLGRPVSRRQHRSTT